MSLTKIGSIGINTGIQFAGVTTVSTLKVGSGVTLSSDGDVFATGISTFSEDIKVGSGITLSPDGDGFYTGVVTATTFSGSLAASNLTGALPAISGANLTNLDASDLASGTVPTARLGSGTASSSTFLRGDSTFATPTSTTINSNADNRVITGSGTANTLNGESTLTYDASLLNIVSSTQGLGLRLQNTGNEYTEVRFDAARTGAGAALGILQGRWNNSQNVCSIYLQAGDDTTNKDDGRISMLVQSASGSSKTAFKIEPDASIQLPNDSQKLQIGNDQDLNIWHGGSNGYIDNETGDLIFRTTGSNTERLRIEGSSGRIGIQGSPTKGVLDVRASGGSADKLTAVFGANEGQTGGTLSDNADKACRIGSYHYDTDEEPFGILVASGTNGANNLTFGGGTSLMNAATSITFHTAANSTTTAGTNRLTIDSDGRLIVGGGTHTGGSALVVKGGNQNTYSTIGMFGNQTNPASGVLAQLRMGANTTAVGADIRAAADAQWGSSDYPTRLEFGTVADGSSSRTERMRILSSGHTKISNNGTYQSSTAVFHEMRNSSVNQHITWFTHTGVGDVQYGIRIQTANEQNDTSHNYIDCREGGSATRRFIVYANGNVQNQNNSYGSLSDEKLKENITDANSQWDDIKTLKVRNFNFINDSNKVKYLGLVAQEAETVCPSLVFTSPDTEDDSETGEIKETGTETKSLKYSVLYMKAIKCLQEAQTRIETLETEVAALKSS